VSNIRYFVHGTEVSRGRAIRAWEVSATYKRAAHNKEIFWKAEQGIDDGGVANHLREAGIEVIIDGQQREEA